MKTFKILVAALLVAILISTVVPTAMAAQKQKAKTIYSVVVVRQTHTVFVFSRKSNSKVWKYVGKAQCATGNPYWPTPAGTFTVKKKRSSCVVDGDKSRYVTYFGPRFLVFCAKPKHDREGFYALGNSCTMGQVWLDSAHARWLYNKVPTGTKVYIF